MTYNRYILAVTGISLIVSTITAGLFFADEPVNAGAFAAAFFMAMLVALRYFLKK